MSGRRRRREGAGPIWALTAVALVGGGAIKRTPTSPWMSKSTAWPESGFASRVCSKREVILTTLSLPGQGWHEASAASSKFRDTRLEMRQRLEKSFQLRESGSLRN